MVAIKDCSSFSHVYFCLYFGLLSLNCLSDFNFDKKPLVGCEIYHNFNLLGFFSVSYRSHTKWMPTCRDLLFCNSSLVYFAIAAKQIVYFKCDEQFLVKNQTIYKFLF